MIACLFRGKEELILGAEWDGAREKNRAIQSAQLELERQQASDSLRKGLEKRPEREELVERTYGVFDLLRIHPSIHLSIPACQLVQ